jgi:phosphoribosylglycinamide formyltransferase-1
MEKINLAVLISGSGTNLQALIDACKKPDYPARISLVISNVPGAYGLERASKAGIPAVTVNHRSYESREEFEEAMQNELKKYPADLICLAGFMRILTPYFIEKWEGKILNTHPALLPEHGGPGMYGEKVHKAVLKSGDRESGASIHIVTPECDKGPVIIQKRVPVLDGDTPGTLAARVLEQEHAAYVEAVRMFAENKIDAF